MPEASSPSPRLSYRGEMKRKATHFVALVIPVSIMLVPSPIDWIVLGGLALLAMGADVARVRIAVVNRLIQSIFGGMMRPHELPPVGGPVVINGATWVLASGAICALAFPSGIAATALGIMMIGDAAAAAVGMRYGRIRYPWNHRTLEGTLAFVVAGVLAAIPFAAWSDVEIGAGPALIAAVAAAAVEALPLPINDNVVVPVAAGLLLVLLV